jgi:type VII secretion protein EccB
MPLNYASWEQVSGWRFLIHRLSVAVGRRTVRLIHDPSKNNSAALLVSAVIAVLVIGLSFVLGFFSPAGQIGDSRMLADRASGGLYVDVGGVLHPALNLASARLIIGSPDNPKMVRLNDIRKYPIGPTVGIVGAPNDLAVRAPATSGWTLCDWLGSAGSQVTPKVTVISGLPRLEDWASELTSPRAALMSYRSGVYVVTDGHRSQIDLADRAVTLALGLPGGDLHPAAMSRALYEALTPTQPMQVPAIPAPGGALWYASAQLPVVSGNVIRVADTSGDPQFFLALPAGVQMVSQTVARMIRNAGIVGAKEISVPGYVIAAVPQIKGFDLSMFPPGRLQLVDKTSEPVTCVAWRKGSGETQARVSVITGRRLPIPMGHESRLVRLVNAGAQVADEVYIGADSANFVQVTGVDPASPRDESLWLISDNGVRFGVVTAGQQAAGETLRALGLDRKPTPAPWAMIHWLPAGPALSKAAALTEHDTLAPDPSPAPLTTKPGTS